MVFLDLVLLNLVFLCMVHCNSLVCDSKRDERCFIFSPSLGGFCSSLGGTVGRVFIHTGAFTDWPPEAGPVRLSLAAGVSAGSIEFEFSMSMASAEVVAGFGGLRSRPSRSTLNDSLAVN